MFFFFSKHRPKCLLCNFLNFALFTKSLGITIVVFSLQACFMSGIYGGRFEDEESGDPPVGDFAETSP